MRRWPGEAVERALVVGLGTVVAIGVLALVAGIVPWRSEAPPPAPTPPEIEVGLIELAPPEPVAAESQPETTVPPEPSPPVAEAPPPEPPREPVVAPVPPPVVEPPPRIVEPAPPPPPPEPKPKPKPVVKVAKPAKPTPTPAQAAPTPPAEPSPAPPAPAPPVAASTPAPVSPAPASDAPESGGTSAARAIYQPMPEIPPELRHRAGQFVAEVVFAIAPDGSARAELREATPDPRLNRILIAAFAKWRFFPAMERGKPVASSLTLRVPITVE